MDRDIMLKMVMAMRAYGGGFVVALSECFIRADEINMQKLINAFPEYVEQYLAMAGIENYSKKEVMPNEGKDAEEEADESGQKEKPKR